MQMSEIAQSEIKNLISQPNPKLVDVLVSPFLVKEIHAENAKLYNFLQQDAIITELAEWCFTEKYKENAKFNEISDLAVSILLSTNSMIQFLLENKSFSKILYEFLIGNDSKNSRLCGHFSRVLSVQIRWDTPLLFIEYHDVQQRLLDRVEMLGIRELISNIILSNSNIIDCEKMIEDLSRIADVDNNIDALYLVISIFKNVINESHLIYLFDSNNTVLNHLVNIACKTKSPVVQSDILNCLFMIQFQPSMIDDQTLIEKMTISENNINDLSIAAIDLLQIPIEILIDLFFSKNATEKFHKKLMIIIESMNLQQLVEIANIPNFVVNLINSFDTCKWCPHCFQLTIFFINIEDYCRPLRSKKWRTFVFGKFYPIVKILNHQYGGHVPLKYESSTIENSSDNDDSNSENEDIQFEEEEEFYDCDCCCYEEDGANIENIENSDNSAEYDIDV